MLDALVAGPAPVVAAGLEVRREGVERAAQVSLALVARPARGDGPLPLSAAVGVGRAEGDGPLPLEAAVVGRAWAVDALSSESVSSPIGWLYDSAINLVIIKHGTFFNFPRYDNFIVTFRPQRNWLKIGFWDLWGLVSLHPLSPYPS